MLNLIERQPKWISLGPKRERAPFRAAQVYRSATLPVRGPLIGSPLFPFQRASLIDARERLTPCDRLLEPRWLEKPDSPRTRLLLLASLANLQAANNEKADSSENFQQLARKEKKSDVW